MLSEEELRDAALLVFANKQDQPGAKGAGEISEALKLGELRDRNWSIVACSAIDGRGVDEGMDWLTVSPLLKSLHSALAVFLGLLTARLRRRRSRQTMHRRGRLSSTIHPYSKRFVFCRTKQRPIGSPQRSRDPSSTHKLSLVIPA